MKGRILIIAGSDPSGGAGIQADIKTVTALGGYAMTAITAVTVQNTTGVTDVHPIPASVIKAQAEACLQDIGADVIKLGMIGSVDVARVIHEVLLTVPDIPVVLDPVLVATSGDTLSGNDVAEYITSQLLPLSAVVTPNLPEAALLSGIEITDDTSRNAAAQFLMEKGAGAVLLKDGHGDSAEIRDALYTADKVEIFANPRRETRHTHGTGCTLASALATGLAQGKRLCDASRLAIDYTQEAIRRAPGYGAGNGPLNHAHTVQ
ncbi:bifunctional hydroxymethylpyrimidine kinase/phosphomethylpyrimidine kinase [Parvularcula sp. IMCC14364]|uniref:bifunctional hydroxymethylpyrimidine kinase/phosphomethylpyrimidine kinase n=1 Tax=Parvularcula sp. IMCC14364 TaxID=3067902 RepID=UPI002740AEAF|nr:bifunctional hydroxymethylpyrimidine kinase/phosphomethylpyrimidine kinase [Parvularcula sp. IMCC14364]